jgi:hypothetical protein
MSPRVTDRAHFTPETRISLVESDLDTIDARLLDTNERLGKILWALVGLLISVTTASVLLAINLVAR